jgi:serine protease
LLYSAPCNGFAQGALDNPAATALNMKTFILDGVDQTAQLQSELVSGGRFNVNNSLQLLLDACDEGQCMAPFNLESTQESGTLNYVLSWTDILAAEDYRLSYRIINSADWINQEINNLNTHLLPNLQACTTYEARVAAYCGDTLSVWSDLISWTTDGCCINPDGLAILASSDSTLSLIWNDVLATDAYVVTATDDNGLTQTWNTTAGGFFILNDLLPCMTYAVQITSGCTSPSGPAAQLTTFTPGCENCALIPYCETSGNDDVEFIEYFSMGDLEYASENSGGYLLVPNITDTLFSGTTYTVSCTPGYNGNAYSENFRVWIDFNLDGDFDDDGELIFDPNPTTINVQGSITLPNSLTEGHSRLRVSMTYTPISSNNEPEPCGNLTYGEVEDYCVVLALGNTINNYRDPATTLSVYPNPAVERIRIEGLHQRPPQIDLMAADGRKVCSLSTTEWPSISITAIPTGVYFLAIQTSEGRHSLPLIVHE